MAKNTLDSARLEPEKIRDLLKSKEEYKVALRLQMVYLIHQGKSSREVADIYQVSFKQVLNWVHRFEREGLEGLIDRGGKGRKPNLSVKEMSQIKNTILKKSPAEFGYSSKRWTGPLLLKWINREYGTAYTTTAIYKLLDKIGVEFQNGKGYVLPN